MWIVATLSDSVGLEYACIIGTRPAAGLDPEGEKIGKWEARRPRVEACD